MRTGRTGRNPVFSNQRRTRTGERAQFKCPACAGTEAKLGLFEQLALGLQVGLIVRETAGSLEDVKTVLNQMFCDDHGDELASSETTETIAPIVEKLLIKPGWI